MAFAHLNPRRAVLVEASGVFAKRSDGGEESADVWSVRVPLAHQLVVVVAPEALGRAFCGG